MFLPFKRGKQISPFIDPLIVTPFIVKMMLSMMQNALAGEIHLQRKILVYCLGTPTAAAMRQIVEETEEKDAMPQNICLIISPRGAIHLS